MKARTVYRQVDVRRSTFDARDLYAYVRTYISTYVTYVRKPRSNTAKQTHRHKREDRTIAASSNSISILHCVAESPARP
jgi:hypothetical protein